MCIDTERFERARGRVIGIERQRLGIGTLSEKTAADLAAPLLRFSTPS